MKKGTKLSLKKVEISELSSEEQQMLNGGGFLSIGHECSVANTCGRLIRNEDTEGVRECLYQHGWGEEDDRFF